MELHVPDYLAQLNVAKDLNILDWDSPSTGRYERTVGKLTVIVEQEPATRRHTWALRHANRGTLTMGASESAELAKHEAILYAIHWVRTAMVGVLA